MGLVILFVVLGITYFVFCQDAYRDSESTIKSKELAKSHNGIFYNQYGGGGKIKCQRLISTGEKVDVDIFGNVHSRGGKTLFNIHDVYRRQLLEISKAKCEERGYKGFYIYVTPESDNREPNRIRTTPFGRESTYLCIETETNRLFWWVRERDLTQKQSDPPYLFRKWYKGKPGHTNIKAELMKYPIDIVQDLNKIRRDVYSEAGYVTTYLV